MNVFWCFHEVGNHEDSVFCHPYNMNVVLQVFLAYNTFLMNVFSTYLTWVF